MRYSDKKLFSLIRGRPAMFIGEHVNIYTLSTFWTGYMLALINNQLDDGNELMSRAPSFDDWVAMQLGYYESTSGWVNMISDITGSDEAGWELFFKYLDEYFERKAVVLYDTVCKEIILGADCTSYKNVVVQIVSYNQAKEAVFLRLLDEVKTLIVPEWLCSSYDSALDNIQMYYPN